MDRHHGGRTPPADDKGANLSCLAPEASIPSCPGIKHCGSATRRAGLAKTVGICKGPRREQPANRQQRMETSDKGEEEKAEERLTQLCSQEEETARFH